MYAPGHVGIALAVYAPVGGYLLRRRRPGLAVAGIAAVAGASLLPDADLLLPWVAHRGPTHTVWFAAVVGGALGGLGWLLPAWLHGHGVHRFHLGAGGFGLGVLSVLAHLLGDVVTPMGIRPLDPVSDASYSADLVAASDPTANAALLALGGLLTLVQIALVGGLGPGSPAGAGRALRTRRRSRLEGRPASTLVGPATRPDRLSGAEADD